MLGRNGRNINVVRESRLPVVVVQGSNRRLLVGGREGGGLGSDDRLSLTEEETTRMRVSRRTQTLVVQFTVYETGANPGQVAWFYYSAPQLWRSSREGSTGP